MKSTRYYKTLNTKYGKTCIPEFSSISMHSYPENKTHPAKIPSMFGSPFLGEQLWLKLNTAPS